ncbi:sensor histidine kinase [Geomesophilobacter sediminis]|uniref:histidine kinase n=1 Tax=Geomesophilobacter sediminis TaxID=2798584 RepID=A0A8J7LV79_9BACT|nr:response regulator [Geomesophilobacter sediminis]MBJ6724645.1 response regulator [Geomesophilobacter sediminis]
MSEVRVKGSGSSTMLIVEDDRASRLALVEVLSERYPDLELYFAEDGETGLALFQEVQPQIVVTDLSMPGMDGLTMAGEIRKLAVQVPIVVLTAYSESSRIIECIRLGINRYVLKPIELRPLFEAIDESLQRFRDIAERERAECELRHHRDNLERLVRERTKELEERNRQLAKEVQQRKQAEQEVIQLNADLEKRVLARTAELQAAIRDHESFSYSVSHDLRTPLRHINSYSTMLEELLEAELTSEGRHCLDRIKVATRTMSSLIDHLLDLSRISRSALTCEDVDLSEIAQGIATTLRETDAQRRVEFSVQAGLHAKGDRILLRQLLENLIGNAWKYSSPRPAAQIEFGRTTVDRHNCFFVKDNGVGFDMTYSEKLFQIFERLHGSEFEGQGIGLATVKKILQRHSGKVWADSKPGQGATFYFTL